MTTTAYDDLYENLRKTFCVDCNGHDGTLGEYMQTRAMVLRTQSLPIRSFGTGRAITLSAIGRYLQDKMTVKVPPVKDKTIRSFPLCTSMSAALSAITVCGLLFTFTFLGAKVATEPKTETVSYVEPEEPETEETVESDNT